MTPERVAQIIYLFAPIVVGVFLIVVGLVLPNLGWVTVGAGALGVPFITSPEGRK